MERLTDEQIIALIEDRAKEDLSFLKKFDKSEIKRKVISETRPLRVEATRSLWIRYFENHETISYYEELKKIWCGDMVMFHKYVDKFHVDEGKCQRGRNIIFS